MTAIDNPPEGESGGALKSSIALVVTKGVLAAVRLAFLLWMAKNQSVEQFGRLALCFSVVEILRIVADFGTETLFLRHVARAKTVGHIRSELARMAAFRLVAACLGTIIYAVVIFALFRSKVAALELMPAVLLVTMLGINFSLTYYQARLKVDRAAAIILLIVPIYAIAEFASRNQAACYQLAILGVYEFVVAVALFSDTRRVSGFRRGDVGQFLTRLSLSRVAGECLPIAGTMILATAYTRLDVFVVKPLAGAAALGLYSYAYRLSEPFRFVTNAIEATLYGYLSRAISHDAHFRALKLARLWAIVAGYAVVFSGSAAVIGYAVTTLVYPNYRAALPTMFMLCAALFVRCLSGFAASFLNAVGLFRRILWAASLNLLLMLIIIYPLTKRFGIVGAAGSLLLVEGLNAAVQGNFFARAVSAARRLSA
jgi:O-antigen/teichoic acid export membrane protein